MGSLRNSETRHTPSNGEIIFKKLKNRDLSCTKMLQCDIGQFIELELEPDAESEKHNLILTHDCRVYPCSILS